MPCYICLHRIATINPEGFELVWAKCSAPGFSSDINVQVVSMCCAFSSFHLFESSLLTHNQHILFAIYTPSVLCLVKKNTVIEKCFAVGKFS